MLAQGWSASDNPGIEKQQHISNPERVNSWETLSGLIQHETMVPGLERKRQPWDRKAATHLQP